MEKPILVLKSSHLTIPSRKKTPTHPMRGRETACCIWKVKHRISYRSQTIKQKTQLEQVLFENYSELIILLSSQPANLRNWMCNIYHQDIVTQSIKRWQETNCCKHSVGNALRERTCCNLTSTGLVLVRTLSLQYRTPLFLLACWFKSFWWTSSMAELRKV